MPNILVTHIPSPTEPRMTSCCLISSENLWMQPCEENYDFLLLVSFELKLASSNSLCKEYSKDGRILRSFPPSWSSSCRERVDSQSLLSSLFAAISSMHSDYIPHIQLLHSTWSSAAFDRWRMSAVHLFHNFSEKYHWAFDSSHLKRSSRKYTLKYRPLIRWERLTAGEWCTEMRRWNLIFFPELKLFHLLGI